jgi:hypothetical protein
MIYKFLMTPTSSEAVEKGCSPAQNDSGEGLWPFSTAPFKSWSNSVHAHNPLSAAQKIYCLGLIERKVLNLPRRERKTRKCGTSRMASK